MKGRSRRASAVVALACLTAGGTVLAGAPPAAAAPVATHRPGDLFGSAVAVWRSTAIVGADGVNNASGAAYLYVKSGGSWHQQTELLDPGHAGSDIFGASVALSGDTAIVGSPTLDAGSAYVYVRSGSSWHRQATLAGADFFGASVAISGDTAVIGALNANNNIGAVYIYVRSGSTWRKQARLTLPGGGGNVYFGASVALSGNSVLVGAPFEYNGIGAAYVYLRTAGRWRRQRELIDPVRAGSGNFGASVALLGGTALISAPAAKNGQGAIYIYQRSGTSWRSQAKITNPGGRSSTGFGSGVALSNSPLGLRALIGASNGNSRRCGTAYDYARSRARWSEKARIINPGCKPADGFGFAVSLYQRTAFIGAPQKNKDAGAAYDLTIP